ncbi:MAG TPA: hypothetical protein VK206_25390 [Anaerolineales bacterium]|nr:hypothetical protein [Anaerolineales bacterium]
MKERFFSERNIPLLFLLVTIVAYGLLLPRTGFYWDDWPFAWIAKFLGPQEFIPAFAKVRPFLGPIFFVTTSLIPPVPLYWQIFALIIRFLSGLSAWFALSQVWPHHKRQVLIASLLFLVFPGYSQHWVALTHINQEWIPFICYLFSFGFTARALRNASVIPALDLLSKSGAHLPQAQVPGSVARSRWLNHSVETEATKQSLTHARLNTIYALLLLTAGVFPTEYFVSIEPLRFLFIWVILSEEVNGLGQRFIQSLKRWIPYLLIWLANGAWLAYFYTSGGYDSYDVEVVRVPLTIIRIISTVGEAIWKVGIYVWVQVLVLTSKAITAPTTLVTFALILVAFILILFYLVKFNGMEGKTRTFAISAILIGLAGILLGRVPSFAAGLPLTLQSSYDRFMISMMLGGSLFVTGLIELFVRNARIKIYAFALLIALGIGQQFFNANIFRRDWTTQQEIYWQLAWRIPAMKPNIALLTDQLPVDYETDLSFTAPINWIYAPNYKRSTLQSGSVDERSDLPYALLYTEKRLGGASLPSLDKNTEISLLIRRVNFHGSTSQVLVIYMPQNGCLRVLDPERGDQITYGRQSGFLVDAIPLSDLSNIIVTANQTANIPFLSEPKHTWCYYFAKAELARQQGQWDQVIDLIDQAKSLGYKPEDPFEWLTYIEAQALTGNINVAEKVSNDAFKQDNGIRKGLCEVWKRVQAQGPAGSETRVSQIVFDFQCAR